MTTIIAKQFEWHRVHQELDAARRRLTRALSSAELHPGINEVQAQVIQLEARSAELLAELDRLRSAGSTTDGCMAGGRGFYEP